MLMSFVTWKRLSHVYFRSNMFIVEWGEYCLLETFEPREFRLLIQSCLILGESSEFYELCTMETFEPRHPFLGLILQ